MRIYISALLCFALTAAISQRTQPDFNQWSIGLSVGGHDGLSPAAETNLLRPLHYGVDGRYMLNNRFGIMLDLGYDRMKFDSGIQTNYWRSSIQGVLNVGEYLNFNSWTKRVGLLFHAGAGISHLWYVKDAKPEGDVDDLLFDGVDDMLNFTFGITPQLKLSERVSLNVDLSYTLHHRQTYDWTLTTRNSLAPVNGYMFNASIGASFYLGKKKSHADWTPTVYGSDNEDLYNRIKELEAALEDNDGDGVPNSRDIDTLTPADAYVNSRGEEIPKTSILDTDNDGFLDAVDDCPQIVGKVNGCPDRDTDGIPDSKDDCPDQAGTKEFNGCAMSKLDIATIDNIAALVYFRTGQSNIKSESKSDLRDLAKMLTENPNVSASIYGHADSTGEEMVNNKLSKDRAAAVKSYLVSKGVAASRLQSEGFGSSRPADSNETSKGKAKNRRVEIVVSSISKK